MKLRTLSLACLLGSILVSPCATQAQSRDWFVRAGATAGDGSKGKPFDDPWYALERCEAGDRIHLAEGKYFGKAGAGTWEVPFDRISLIGGYDAAFQKRDPWHQRSMLCWDKTSKNWPKQERLSSLAHDLVIDGLVIDMSDQVEYQDEQLSGRAGRLAPTAIRLQFPATVRNCMVLNPGEYGIACGTGSQIVNNLVVNAMGWGIVVTGSGGDTHKAQAVLENNTVLFTWDVDKPGGGGYPGSALALRGPARLTANILAYSDNHGIYGVTEAAKVAVTGNVFAQNRFSNLSFELSGVRAVFNDKNTDDLEELGLQAGGQNVVVDPPFGFDPAAFGWKPKRAGLIEGQPKDKDEGSRYSPRKLEMPKGIAPACSIENALTLLVPSEKVGKAGARIVAVGLGHSSDGPVSAVAKTYTKVPLASWYKDAAKVDGKPVEFIAAIGGVANVSSMPAKYKQDTIAGVDLYDPDGEGNRVIGFYTKGTSVDRECQKRTGWYRGQGKPEVLHVVRGIAYETKGVPKSAIYVESIERYEPEIVAAKRPTGRDWFVRAGATGGDGTREKPFKDPYQALERCEAGDMIHVTGGEYVGKLKAGHWTVAMPFVALLGGYDAEFKTRDPWNNPTRLVCPAEFQGRRGGYTLEGDSDHTGTIVDGFVFDKRLNNVYTADGSLDVGHSDKTEHLWLARPDCVVRNCVFMNGAFGAVRVATGQVLENNVFVNHYMQTVAVEKGHTVTPIVVRNNTLLFAWHHRPAMGLGSNGHLLSLGGQTRAIVTNNVFAWADNDAVRISADPGEVVLTGNLFANNLWSNVQYTKDYQAFDDKNWAQIAALGLKACEANVFRAPGLAVDATFLGKHDASRTTGAKKTASETPKPAANPFDSEPAKEKDAEVVAGEAFAPAYELGAALKLFATADAPIGARVLPLPVAFTGQVRVEEKHEYVKVDWETARSADAWDKFAGKRVELQVAIGGIDNQFWMPEIKADEYAAFRALGPLGIDSGGLPLRCYVKKGTKHFRAVEQAKSETRGKPEELHVVRGVALAKRQMLVESVELVK